MKNITQLLVVVIVATAAGLASAPASAQTYTENFTGTSTTNSWTFITGACLTMGTAATSTAANPACSGLPYYSSVTLIGGNTGTLPDTTSGALRMTDWFSETGAILSNFNFTLTGAGAQGLQVSFTTVTYAGDSGGTGKDGADGISFFLQDATYPPDVGAFGGSLAYSCTNTNNNTTLRANGIPRGYDGLQGGYIGLGIDEYGNFLNSPDNTSTGQPATTGSGQFQWGRIGLRGPGSTTWTWLNTNYPNYYPSTLTNSQTSSAVQQACKTGYVWDWSQTTPVETAIQLTNYGAIPGAYSILPASRQIANEAATTRGQAIPITYNLKVTPTGLLSLAYSYNGGALQNVITNQDITANGTVPIPANVRFGFAGSTGGSRNVHEIMCFQATPANTSQSSAGLNQKQTAKVQTGTQAYFAYYSPTTLAGSLTSQYLGQPVGDSNPNDLIISSTINWDGSCVLTGVAAGAICDLTGPAGPVAAQGSTSRNIFTWNDSSKVGVPFEWANLSPNEQSSLNSGDAASTTPPPFNYSRLNYLRGVRSDEQTPTSSTTFVGVFRDRASVLGDIVNSSPTWVGPPNITYPNTWTDSHNASGDTMSENSGQTYATYMSSSGFGTRTNVVYAGANDGLLHGFRTGSFTTPTTYNPATNDGQEVLAYMPGYIVNTIQTATTTAGVTTYNSPSNYSDPQYGHHFDVDSPPGTGDLYYAGKWHTWLVGGLGRGGNAIYALDVTDPDNTFAESSANAQKVVVGEWSTLTTTTSTTTAGVTTTTTVNNSTTLTCLNDSGTPCGYHLGRTYGVPEIRRFHNGSWGAVFGNGGQGVGGDAGIYVMLVNPSTGPTSGGVTFYYLSTSTGSATSPNGIYYAVPADFDGDHITDYVYAGDLLGNVWRFDLTNTNPAKWGVTNAGGVSINASTGGGGSATPLYTTPSGQPITTQVVVAAIANTNGNPRVLIEFGTGEQTPLSNGAAAQFQTQQQGLYGFWDWNLGGWNSTSTILYDALPGGGVAAPSSALSGTTPLQQQTITGTYAATIANTGSDYRTVSTQPICWADTPGCTQYGWYMNLVKGNAYSPDPAVPQNGNAAYASTPVIYEQVIYNPVLALGAFIVNTTIPPAAAATMCFSSAASGWTMAIDPTTGGAFVSSFFDNPGTHSPINVTSTTTSAGGTTTTQSAPISGAAFGGTGSVSMVQAGTQYYALMQTVNGVPALPPANPQGNYVGSRLTWIQRR